MVTPFNILKDGIKSVSNGNKYYPCVKYDNYTRFKGYLWDELFFGTKHSYVTEVMRSNTDNTERVDILME